MFFVVNFTITTFFFDLDSLDLFISLSFHLCHLYMLLGLEIHFFFFVFFFLYRDNRVLDMSSLVCFRGEK